MTNGALKKAARLLFFLAFGLTILALVFRSQNAAYHEQCRLDGIPDAQCSLWDKLWNDFSTVHPGWMFLVGAAFTLSNMFRAWRWQMLLRPMGHEATFANSLLTILLGYFANLGFPRMGEVVRAGSLARYERIPVQKVMGTLVVDRLMDFICLGLVVGLAFLFEADTLWAFINRNRQPESGSILNSYPVMAAGAALVLGVILAYFFRRRLMQLPLAKRLATLVEGFWEGLRSVFRLEKTGLFLLLSVGIWVMFYLQCLFNLQAFPPTAQLPAGAALMVFVFGTLGFVAPSPGGMGTFHALVIAGLALYGIGGADAFSYANIAFFAIQIFYNIAAGLLALALLPVLNRKSDQAVPQT